MPPEGFAGASLCGTASEPYRLSYRTIGAFLPQMRLRSVGRYQI